MRLLAPLLLCLSLPAAAEVYRWVDKEGVIHYTDRPPNKDAKPAQLPPIQTISGGFGSGRTAVGQSAAEAGQGAQDGAPSPLTLTIVSPHSDETLRGADRTVTVSVALQQPLPDGAGLVYYLDGNAQNNPPTQSLSLTLGGVERGSHLLAVAAVDAQQRELGRSAPVIVHMKPPSAK